MEIFYGERISRDDELSPIRIGLSYEIVCIYLRIDPYSYCHFAKASAAGLG